MDVKIKWVATKVACWELPKSLEFLQSNGCVILEIWKYAHEAIILFQDGGHYPKGINPLAGDVT